MALIKKSFNKAGMKKSKKGELLGAELGGAISNDVKSYAKTGKWRYQRPEVSDACVACGICTMNCPEAAIEIKEVDGKKKAVINLEYCKGCGICPQVCPVKAIRMVSDK